MLKLIQKNVRDKINYKLITVITKIHRDKLITHLVTKIWFQRRKHLINLQII